MIHVAGMHSQLLLDNCVFTVGQEITLRAYSTSEVMHRMNIAAECDDSEGGFGESMEYTRECQVDGTWTGPQSLCPETIQNIALGKPTIQSSESYGGIAKRAVDGNIDGAWGSSSCSSTSSGAFEWWQVDLGATYEIHELRIYHRTDCCEDYLRGARVYISETSNYNEGVECHVPYVDGAQPEVGTCDQERGDFITVTNNQNLQICELEASGVGPF